MRARSWLVLATFGAAMYDVGTIWMVHIGYLLWPDVGPQQFGRYHGHWWVSIIPVIFPVYAVAFLGSLAMLRWRPPHVPGWALWLGASIQVVAAVLTAFVWAPMQNNLGWARLPDGTISSNYTTLYDSHWVRVALHTGYGVLMVWTAARALAGSQVPAPAATSPGPA
jgi:hypothetical protein